MEPLNERLIRSLLRPGDILLYDRPGFFGYIIKRKRGERYTHCEVAVDAEHTVASRDGIGVGKYSLRLDGLAAIYCTDEPLNLDAGLEWFKTVNGQKYDWIGLLAFTWAKFRGRSNNRMFCSEFVVRFMRACGVDLFNGEMDADAVSPEMLSYSPRVRSVWLRKDKRRG
jgi:hypothetical protein